MELKKIPRGHLNAVVSIQAETRVQSASGDTSGSTWANAYTDLWAYWEETKGQESFEANKKVHRELAKVTLDYLSDVTEEHRLVFDSKNYRILDVETPRGRGGANPDMMVLKVERFNG